MPLANDREHPNNRDEALYGTPSGGKHRNTDDKRVRDQKPPAMFYNEDHSNTTTVEYLPEEESRIEAGLLSELKRLMEQHGAKGRICANPGWLPFDPAQRVGHEAPARLNSQTFRTGMGPAAPGSSKPTKAKTSTEKEAEAEEDEEDAKTAHHAAAVVPHNHAAPAPAAAAPHLRAAGSSRPPASKARTKKTRKK